VTRKWVKEMKLMYNILVVDDDKEIVESIEIFLKNEGYNVYKAYNGMEALDVLVNNDVHLILMDIMMPKLDGIKATIKIREEKNIPIILVSAKSEDTDKIMGLNIGADDYITKPFNLLELIARVKSNLRRYVTLGTYNNEKLGNNEVLISGGLELNTSTKEVKVDGQIVRVTPIEFKILNLLIANKGRVFSIDEIYEKVWNEESFNVENTVAVHIRRIRGKIEINPKEPRYLKVVWGVGYKIEKL
jgi:DNA-binding response OmpR family regulator